MSFGKEICERERGGNGTILATEMMKALINALFIEVQLTPAMYTYCKIPDQTFSFTRRPISDIFQTYLCTFSLTQIRRKLNTQLQLKQIKTATNLHVTDVWLGKVGYGYQV